MSDIEMSRFPARFRDSLEGCLRYEVGAARALHAALLEEQRIMAGHDDGLIEEHVARKEELVGALQEATTARVELMREGGFSDDWAGIENCIAACGACQIVDGLFSELTQVGRQCIQENRLVGQLINRRVQFLHKALSSFGAPAREQGLAYESSGKALNTQGGRSVGCA